MSIEKNFTYTLPSFSRAVRTDASDAIVTTQKPFDWPLALFSKNLTSATSFTPMLANARITSSSEVHCMIEKMIRVR